MVVLTCDEVRELSRHALKAFATYIDTTGCGDDSHVDDEGKHVVRWSIPKRIRDKSHDERTSKERACFYAGTLSASKIAVAILTGRKLYFTGNQRSGFALFYIDIDAHDGQTDRTDLVTAIAVMLGDNVYQHDGRLYLKVFYDDGGFAAYEKAANNFIKAVEAWRIAAGFKSNVDAVKSIRTLGRLPTQDFIESDLERFVATPDTTLDQLASFTKVFASLAPKVAKPARRHRGSMSYDVPFTQDELDSIPDMIRTAKPRAYQLREGVSLHPEEFKPKDRRLISEDIAQFHVLTTLLRRHPNEDGSCPHARLEACWRSLVESGHFRSKFHSTKITCLRNLFSAAGMIDWPTEGNHYRYSEIEGEKDRAMRWSIGAEHAVQTMNKEERESCYPPLLVFSTTYIRPVMLPPKRAPRPVYQGSKRVNDPSKTLAA